MYRKIFACALTLLLGACQSRDRSASLILYNQSDRNIHYFLSCDSSYENLNFGQDRILKPGDSIRPYLLYGPEGKGPSKNTWVNAINLGDDSSLHVFFCYLDLKNDPNLRDSLFYLIVHRENFTVDSLERLHWKVVYHGAGR